MCACVCAFTPYSPQGATRAGVFSCSNFVRSTPPRQDGAARACRDLPAFWGGSAARDEERPSVYADRSEVHEPPAGRGAARNYPAVSGAPRRSGGYRPREDNVSGLNIQFDIVLFRTDIDCPARGGARARRPTSDVPATEACAPHCRGLLVRPLVGGPATMTPDMMRGATRRSVKKKVDLEVKHASRLSE